MKVFQDNIVFVDEVFANGGGLFSVFSRALVQVPESSLHNLHHSSGHILKKNTTNTMISDMLVHEKKPPFVNQHRVAYKFQCDLCHASHVRYTLRHMHQRAAEHTVLFHWQTLH